MRLPLTDLPNNLIEFIRCERGCDESRIPLFRERRKTLCLQIRRK